MKKNLAILLLGLLSIHVFGQWQPAGDKIRTAWAEQIDVNNVLPEYPRPILERNSWKNLNGLWEYAITKAGAVQPKNFDGEILVPFAVESSLSGVQKRVGAENELWYKRSFTVPSNWKNKNVLLHFGAVDWKSDIWINGIKVGTHKGGYTPFSFNITSFLTKSGEQELVVKVWDPSEKGYQPRGKQTSNPKGIWYTPVTGIWQTVWLEPVAEKYIENVRITPDIDNNRISVELTSENTVYADVFEAVVTDGNRQVATAKASTTQELEISIPEATLWDTENPFLYDIKIKLIRNGKIVDEVDSYFAMRKISTKRDENGIVRLQLNNKDQFQFGPLDQGWWPDGLYTAPCDEALKYDIQKTKDFGFNMIRKHVKVEPARWYTHCDRMGILVWQDMPSGDRSPRWQNQQYFNGTELKRSAESEANYRAEWKEIMDYLYSNPSVVCWVPFNEAWGQFKTEEIVEWTKAYDPSRLVNPASGGNHYTVGDMLDLHNYPGPEMYLYDAQRATVLGEYGGIGLALEGHLWASDRNWGYVQFKNSKEVTDEYVKYAEKLMKMIKTGFSAAVYTQTTDVEGEVNGLMTYDRKVIKLEENRLKNMNREIVNSLNR
uniref:glycoside hydrolase family 2 protein n=1 Tax=uncultured Draconibacterium sp. TaxID=1573823 RepID=UPI0032176B3D